MTQLDIFHLRKLTLTNEDELFESKTQIIRTNILRRTTDRALQLCTELEKDERFKYKRYNKLLAWLELLCLPMIGRAPLKSLH